MATREEQMLQAVEDSLGPAIVDADVLAGELERALEMLGDVQYRLGLVEVRLGTLRD